MIKCIVKEFKTYLTKFLRKDRLLVTLISVTPKTLDLYDPAPKEIECRRMM